MSDTHLSERTFSLPGGSSLAVVADVFRADHRPHYVKITVGTVRRNSDSTTHISPTVAQGVVELPGLAEDVMRIHPEIGEELAELILRHGAGAFAGK